ncbi:PP2C family serine/threonine-protein phosphatase [Jeotgalibacillus proteolyticus]|uniref:Phosphoserine phosphatase n=1 Tax=Jeotgalibacillus proteolyticus TaxID=2082395 RepID=A0A2S5GC20_9BACL|nr:PP2C family serine/threonine-protein phosphatase [Jeotgalibacillus proteolyticus]PPA70539.1 phosphoserine phosphatase [Jeotgalibacillus proteolyticus]
MDVLHHEKVRAVAGQYTKMGKSVCGDSYFMFSTEEYFICILADGLGSGTYANEASTAACDVVAMHHEEDVETLMERCNHSLLKKRGAAVAIVKIDLVKKVVQYSCVGNVRFYFYSHSGNLTYPLPVTGYLSGRPQKFKVQRFVYEDGASFLLHSDGLVLTRVRPLLQSHHSLDYISSQLESIVSGTDDTTFVIGRLP